MLKRATLSLLGLTGLAACGSEAPPAANKSAPRMVMANPHHDALKALTPELQLIGVRRAVRDTGNRCNRALATGYQQDYENTKMWTLTCDDRRQWAVFIGPNADIQVRNCADAATLGIPACRPLDVPAATGAATKG